ncbi:MAG: carbon-nitrogen hydrolase family protein [Euryarchaeota archaeon]|nr:carbon-nitrogen hydrolase family protein [Euryarchaeota archaeon]
MRLGLATERPAVGNVKANLKTVEARVRASHADLVLFGELYLTGYVIKDQVANLALSVKGREIGRLRDLAKETGRGILAGFPRADDERRGVVYDSAVFVDKKGKVDWYDKWFLANFGPFEEKLYFADGRRLPLFEQDGVRFGVQMCYDLFFPELAKTYAVTGADMIVNLSASPTVSRRNFELLFPARAVENGCFVAYCNVAGTQEDMVFWGGSQVWGPRGDRKVLAPYNDPSYVEVDVDTQEIRAARPLRPTIRDTRRPMVDALAKALDRLER